MKPKVLLAGHLAKWSVLNFLRYSREINMTNRTLLHLNLPEILNKSQLSFCHMGSLGPHTPDPRSVISLLKDGHLSLFAQEFEGPHHEIKAYHLNNSQPCPFSSHHLQLKFVCLLKFLIFPWSLYLVFVGTRGQSPWRLSSPQGQH